MLELLFQYGRFSPTDVDNSAGLLVLFAGAMPVYALASLATRALTVAGRADLTLRAAVHALVVNAVLSAALAPWLGVAGLAWANLGSAAWQYVHLRRSLGRVEPAFVAEGLSRPLLQVLFGSLVLAAVAYQSQRFFADHLYGMMAPKPLLLVTLSLGALLGAGIYAWILSQFGYPERDLLRTLLRRRGAV